MLGMLTVNFKLVMGAAENGSPWLTGARGLVDGKAAALFVVIAGVGTSLLARREGAKRILLRRALVLFGLGLVFSLIWPGDILHFYGVYIALAVAFVRKPSSTLFVAALLGALIFIPMLAIFDYDAHWDWKTLEYSQFWSIDGFVRHLLFNGFHPVVPWMSFFLGGMLLGRMNLRSPRLQRSLLVGGVVVYLVVETLSRLVGNPGDDSLSFVGTQMMPPLPFYLLAAGSSAVAFLMLALIVANRFPNALAIRAISLSGRFSLTIYLAHAVVGMSLLDWLGLIAGSGTAVVSALGFAIAFWLSMIVFALVWRRYHRLGPAEHIFRTLCGEAPKNGNP